VRRRIDPLYVVSAIVAIAALITIVLTSSTPATGPTRSGSVYDNGPGGAGALRRYLAAMGASTTSLEGDLFEPTGASVVVILGASEAIGDRDIASLRGFVRSGGTLVVATELGIAERALLDSFGMRVSGIAAPGTHPLANAAFADPPARSLSVDRAVGLVVPASAEVLATDGRTPFLAAVREGSGVFIAAGSLWPFLNGGLGEADNARAVLALVKPALSGRVVAFDEFHHGVHPTSDVMVLVEETWPGRALVFVMVVSLLYLVFSGRRLGPPVPLEVRPSRSSLEYVRGFAGLVRRSGHGEIARRRLRADLQTGLARGLGLDPATPFDRVLSAIGARDRERAARARAIDDALARPLREDQLLRTVREIEQLLAVA
jgi:hypothetical protein